MESKDLNEGIEWEARRVAAAFGVKQWRPSADTYGPSFAFRGRSVEGILVEVSFHNEFPHLPFIQIGKARLEHPTVVDIYQRQLAAGTAHNNELMARGLYRLGFEDEGAFANIIADLNHPLTAHEKLELRLSLPREFWPQKWLDEEANEATSASTV